MRTLLLAFALVASLACSPARGTRIVLITLDTLRLDAFRDGSMPRLARRARRGTVFSRFYAATSSTQPTHATLFTGLHPWQHGVAENGAVLPEGHPTLAEVLRASGFETRAVVASFPVSRRFGFARGFDDFQDEFSRSLSDREKPVWEKEWDVPEGGFYAPAAEVTQLALASLDRAPSERQFFWFHYFDPHAPYGGSSGEGLTRRRILADAERGGADLDALLAEVRARYERDVAYLDEALDRLLERLDADADAFETHVFVTSDHGESLGEDGWLGHGWRVSEEQIHVPAVAFSPRLAPETRADVAGSIDVAATLLAFAGISAPSHGIAGRDLTRADAAAAGAYGMRRPAREDSRTLNQLRGPVTVEKFGFYAVGEDGRLVSGSGDGLTRAPDAAPLRPDRELELFRSFERQLGEAAVAPSLDPEDRRRLEALGYVP